jgi:hypothetical protein
MLERPIIFFVAGPTWDLYNEQAHWPHRMNVGGSYTFVLGRPTVRDPGWPTRTFWAGPNVERLLVLRWRADCVIFRLG